MAHLQHKGVGIKGAGGAIVFAAEHLDGMNVIGPGKHKVRLEILSYQSGILEPYKPGTVFKVEGIDGDSLLRSLKYHRKFTFCIAESLTLSKYLGIL